MSLCSPGRRSLLVLGRATAFTCAGRQPIVPSLVRQSHFCQRSSNAASSVVGLSANLARRQFATTSSFRPSIARFPDVPKQPSPLSERARRGYATATSQTDTVKTAIPSPASPKKKRFRFFRFLWRATYVSFFLGLGYLGYNIYITRNPANQAEPLESKKTLVILGSGWGSISLLKKLNTDDYNVVLISPRNYFLFTPLLPSCTTGTIEFRSIMEPVRHIIRHKTTQVKYYEAEVTKIDHENKTVTINDLSDIKGEVSETVVPFDFLVIGVGAENSTFGIPGVKEHACFLKEIGDAQKIRTRVMDCIETATFKGQTEDEMNRLLHMVVVGGGPTGVEFAGELHDFLIGDLKKWVPEIEDKFHVTLVEALPNVLPMFSKQLIEYTEKTFQDENITVRTKTMVKKVNDKTIDVEVSKSDGTKVKEEIPYGCLVWATGNTVRGVIRDFMSRIPAQKNARRGLAVNDYLVVDGTAGIWALGDCSQTVYAPTAQVASQQGSYLARLFNSMARTEAAEQEIAQLEAQFHAATKPTDKDALEAEIKLKGRSLNKIKQMSPFAYSHQGSLAYIGMDRAVADLPWFGGSVSSSTGGTLTYLFWRSAYVSMVFSARNRILVLFDWLKVKMFGRDISRE